MADKKTQAVGTKSVKDAAPKAEPAVEAQPSKQTEAYVRKLTPKLSQDQKQAMGVRAAKKAVQPHFRRHEWFRYVKLGGRHASWRVPRGIHSKTRRHWGYRPPLVSIGYGGPVESRGLHPSGFAEVLVQNEADLAKVDKATQAARIGGTVGGRKAKLIIAAADKAGIRVLNRGEL
jgi:large subunit ribosomal protein L32e